MRIVYMYQQHDVRTAIKIDQFLQSLIALETCVLKKSNKN